MSYVINSIFDTIQGEGARAGTRAMFVRFAGCNLWSGRPEGRERGDGACARWCDTEFATGEKMSALQVVEKMNGLWKPVEGQTRWCVLTGGEPALQIDDALINALYSGGWSTAIETNGTVNSASLKRADWVAVSPKKGGKVRISGPVDELKVVLPGALYPEHGWHDEELLGMAKLLKPDHKMVIPMDPPLSAQTADTVLHPRTRTALAASDNERLEQNLAACLEFVRKHPDWKLGAQLHKQWRLP